MQLNKSQQKIAIATKAKVKKKGLCRNAADFVQPPADQHILLCVGVGEIPAAFYCISLFLGSLPSK